MIINRKYESASAYYALVERDDGTLIELKSFSELTDEGWLDLAATYNQETSEECQQ